MKRSDNVVQLLRDPTKTENKQKLMVKRKEKTGFHLKYFNHVMLLNAADAATDSATA